MEIIFLLILLGVLVAGGFLAAFFWAVRTGQFDDSYTPAVRILFDDGTIKTDKTKNKSENINFNNNSKQESK